MDNILVEHNTIKNLAVFEDTTWNLFNLCISFDIDFNVTLFIFRVDGLDTFNSEVNDKISPLGSEFGSDSGLDNSLNISWVFNVNWFLKN
jgi:hypothetical protein